MRPLRFIEHIAIKYNILWRLLLAPVILALVFVGALLFSEYWHVGVEGVTAGYPWGWDGSENYANPEVYAASALRGAVLCFVASVILGLAFARTYSLYALLVLMLISPWYLASYAL